MELLEARSLEEIGLVTGRGGNTGGEKRATAIFHEFPGSLKWYILPIG